MKDGCTIVFALTGSFCTYSKVLPQMMRLAAQGVQMIPVMSFQAAETDTRFGRAEDWKQKLQEITGSPVRHTLPQVEPLGPGRQAEAMVIAPCTGATLAKLDLSIGDTPVTLAAKSLLRTGCPIVVAPSTNDGLCGSAMHIGSLLARKNFYFVPFGQDDCVKKPNSLVCHGKQAVGTINEVMAGRQIQPVIL